MIEDRFNIVDYFFFSAIFFRGGPTNVKAYAAEGCLGNLWITDLMRSVLTRNLSMALPKFLLIDVSS